MKKRENETWFTCKIPGGSYVWRREGVTFLLLLSRKLETFEKHNLRNENFANGFRKSGRWPIFKPAKPQREGGEKRDACHSRRKLLLPIIKLLQTFPKTFCNSGVPSLPTNLKRIAGVREDSGKVSYFFIINRFLPVPFRRRQSLIGWDDRSWGEGTISISTHFECSFCLITKDDWKSIRNRAQSKRGRKSLFNPFSSFPWDLGQFSSLALFEDPLNLFKNFIFLTSFSSNFKSIKYSIYYSHPIPFSSASKSWGSGVTVNLFFL